VRYFRFLPGRRTEGGAHLLGGPATEVRAELRKVHAATFFLGNLAYRGSPLYKSRITLRINSLDCPKENLKKM
jgi:hypothetical protein